MLTSSLKQEKLLTRKEAAEYLDLKEATLAAWATSKKYSLPYIKLGTTVKYKVCDLESFITSRTIR
jgi:hypothetical protein